MAVHVETLTQRLTKAERHRLVRRARFLAWASLAWMTAEGVIAVVAGIMAGSIALIGFGIDSAIEGIASVVIIWRFWGWRALSERAERRAQKLVAVQFFILAPCNSEVPAKKVLRPFAFGRGGMQLRPDSLLGITDLLRLARHAERCVNPS